MTELPDWKSGMWVILLKTRIPGCSAVGFRAERMGAVQGFQFTVMLIYPIVENTSIFKHYYSSWKTCNQVSWKLLNIFSRLLPQFKPIYGKLFDYFNTERYNLVFETRLPDNLMFYHRLLTFFVSLSMRQLRLTHVKTWGCTDGKPGGRCFTSIILANAQASPAKLPVFRLSRWGTWDSEKFCDWSRWQS